MMFFETNEMTFCTINPFQEAQKCAFLFLFSLGVAEIN